MANNVNFEPYTGQRKLRFWCQKVLPLVYDESLSYYELLNKVVEYLNNVIKDVSACESNIEALRDAFVLLQDYVNEQLEDFAPEVERIIDEMVDSGEFGNILAGVVNGLIAEEYDPTQTYIVFSYCIKDGNLYRASTSTTGEWDSTKWSQTSVCDDLSVLYSRVFGLNAGQVAFDSSATYDANTVGNEVVNIKSSIARTYNTDTTYNIGDYAYRPSDGKLYRCTHQTSGAWNYASWVEVSVESELINVNDRITDLNAGDIEYLSTETYNNATVGHELSELKGAINALGSDDVANDSDVSGQKVSDALETLSGATNDKVNKTAQWYSENSFTATRGYVRGDMVFVGDNLYHVTATVAQGASLIAGTNMTLAFKESTLKYYDVEFRFLKDSSLDGLDAQLSASSKDVCYFAWLAGSFTTPVGASRMLILGYANGGNTYATQLAFSFSSQNLYYRRKENGTWYAWSTK